MATISLCMIARDEERLIGQCLKTVVDLVDEIVLIDTGSTDRTVEIAKEFGARVFVRPWDNDFSAARNLSLEMATKEWILVLDADEALDADACAKIKELINTKPWACYQLTQRHYLNRIEIARFAVCEGKYPEFEKDYFGYFQSSVGRLFPNDPILRFQNEIHELIEPSVVAARKYPLIKPDVIIHHYGHTPEQLALKSQSKSKLYEELGLKKIARDPTSARPYEELGVQLTNNNEFEKAIRYLSRAAQLNDEKPETLMNLGFALFMANKCEEAALILNKAVTKDPTYVDGWVNLGALFAKMGNLKDAERCFERAVAFDVDGLSVNNHVNLGRAQLKQGKYQEAKETLSKVEKLVPNSAEVLQMFGVALYKTDKAEEAEKILKKSAKIDKDSAETKYYLGCVLSELGKAEKAMKELALARELAVNSRVNKDIKSFLAAIDKEYQKAALSQAD